MWYGMYGLEKSGDDDLVRKKEGRLQSIAFYMQKAFFKSRKKIVEVGQGSLVRACSGPKTCFCWWPVGTLTFNSAGPAEIQQNAARII